jgi:hypothetical protein
MRFSLYICTFSSAEGFPWNENKRQLKRTPPCPLAHHYSLLVLTNETRPCRAWFSYHMRFQINWRFDRIHVSFLLLFLRNNGSFLFLNSYPSRVLVTSRLAESRIRRRQSLGLLVRSITNIQTEQLLLSIRLPIRYWRCCNSILEKVVRVS